MEEEEAGATLKKEKKTLNSKQTPSSLLVPFRRGVQKERETEIRGERCLFGVREAQLRSQAPRQRREGDKGKPIVKE